MPAYRTAAIASAVFAALLLMAACEGSGDAPQTTAGAPRDLIAFGARTGANGRYGLYLVRPDGSELQKLTDEAGFTFFPRWSPSGDQIAYIVGTEEQEAPGHLRVYDLRSKVATTLREQALPSLQGAAVSWSPDGSRLVFVEAGEEGRLRILDLGRGELVELPELSATAPDWSSVGDDLAVVAPIGSSEGTDLHLIDADSGELRPLLERPGVEGTPRWSPDGRRLAFWAAPAGRPEERRLLVIDRDGENLIELGAGVGAAWSPDGSRLLYSAPAAQNPANLEIYVAAPDQGELQPLFADVTVTLDNWPSWSPAGDRLVYLAQADRQTAFLCVARLQPPERSCLDLPGLVPSAPAWH